MLRAHAVAVLAALTAHVVAQSDVALARRWFERIGDPRVVAPGVSGPLLAQVWTGAWSRVGDHPPAASPVVAFIVQDDGPRFTILTLDLEEREFERTGRGVAAHQRVGYRPLEVDVLARAWLAGEGPDGAPVRPTGVGLFVLSEACRARGARSESDALVDAARDAFERVRPQDVGVSLVDLLARDLGDAEHRRLVTAVGDAAVPVAALQARADAFVRRYPDHAHAPAVRALRAGLERHLDASLPGSDVAPDAAPDELARALVARLHTQNGGQWLHWDDPDLFADPRREASPAHRLVALGLDALPALADAWDDDTPTRTVSTARTGAMSVVSVGAAARIVVDRIAGRSITERGHLLALIADVRARGTTAVFADGAAWTGSVGVRQAAKLAELDPARAVAAHRVALAAESGAHWCGARIALLAAIDRDDARALIDERLANPIDGRDLVAAAAAVLPRDPERALGAAADTYERLTTPPRSDIDALAPFLAACGGARGMRALASRPEWIDRRTLHALAERRVSIACFSVPDPFGGWRSIDCDGAALDRAGLTAAISLVRAVLAAAKLEEREPRLADDAAALLAALDPAHFAFDPGASRDARDDAIRAILGR